MERKRVGRTRRDKKKSTQEVVRADAGTILDKGAYMPREQWHARVSPRAPDGLGPSASSVKIHTYDVAYSSVRFTRGLGRGST